MTTARVTTPEGLQGSVQAGGRRRLAGLVGAGRIWRAGPAGDADPDRHRIPVVGQHGVFDVWRPDHGRHGGADGARQARTEEDVRAEDGGRRVDRHHEPHRAAMRHRSRPAAHQGRQAGRRQLQDHRAPRSSSPPASTISPKTSSIWCWRESRARRPASRAYRCSWCPRSWSMPTARWARATASPAARSNTRWAFTAIPPA